MSQSLPSRRKFLRNTGLFGLSFPVLSPSISRALADLSSSRHSGPKSLPTRPPRSLNSDVIVVGAGLSGLAAATELERAGHSVSVLEARTRPGGRVHTVRDPYADGLHSEVGAVAFSRAYTTANRYIDALGLSRLDYAFPDLAPLYHLGGRRFSTPGDTPVDWPYDLTEEESAAGPIGNVVTYLLQTLPPEIADPDAWNSPALRSLDEVSLSEYMRQQGASEGAIQMVADTQYFGRAPEEASMLSIAVTDIGLFFMGAAMFVLDGGNDRLPTAMSSGLSTSIQYGVEVEGINETETGVEVSGLRNGRPVSIAGDRVIITVPTSVMSRIRIEPGLRPEKQAALNSVVYRDVVRAQFQVRSAFWRDDGVSGFANTDLFGGRIDRQPYSDLGSVDRRSIVETFVEGSDAAELAGRSDDEIFDYAFAQLEQVHPQIRTFAEGGVIKAWSSDPYTMGGWSWPAASDVTAHLEELQRPNGRIHFAGEHTSVLRATMEGALRFGVRAAGEIDAASGG